MERTYAAQVRGADEIKVCGFVENIRNKSKMAFIVLKDITGKVQITVEKGEDEALDNAVNQITLDSVITVIGKAVESEYVKLGGVEIYPKQIIIESLAAPLPIDREARKGHERSSIDQRIDYRLLFFITAVLLYQIADRFDPFCYIRIEKNVRIGGNAPFIPETQRVKSAGFFKAPIDALQTDLTVQIVTGLPKSAVKRNVFKRNVF